MAHVNVVGSGLVGYVVVPEINDLLRFVCPLFLATGMEDYLSV